MPRRVRGHCHPLARLAKPGGRVEWAYLDRPASERRRSRGRPPMTLLRPNRRPGPSALQLEPLPDVLQRLLALGQRELAEDFRGVTTAGHVIPDLFPIARTGVNT